MSHIRHGDAEKLLLNGFNESMFSRLEHQKVVGDYNFFIYVKVDCWKLEIVKFGTNGIGRVEKVFEEKYNRLDKALKKVKLFVIENDLEDVLK